jgi:hypothetical protein
MGEKRVKGMEGKSYFRFLETSIAFLKIIRRLNVFWTAS